MKNNFGLYRQKRLGLLSLYLRCLHDFPRGLVVSCSFSSLFQKSTINSLQSSEASDISDQRSCDRNRIINPDLNGAMFNFCNDQNLDITFATFIKITELKLPNYCLF